METLSSYCERSMARTSFTMVMLALASGMALLLGVVGIYAVISYTVSQRSREIGIRLALGARREELTRMFVRHGLVLAGRPEEALDTLAETERGSGGEAELYGSTIARTRARRLSRC